MGWEGRTETGGEGAEPPPPAHAPLDAVWQPVAGTRGVEAEDDLGVGGVMELRGISGFWEFGAGKKQLLTAENGEICLTRPRPAEL
ncbi:jg17724 [Pararge aegeria aegeria]|uniref:Jg17724 protein n=1 Tax=Pararge aegeria aegeria TaxID=348720 RepID=A0A8S4SB93_9NEOP|nr:jg17724 [Pararge aegeria aegeria]